MEYITPRMPPSAQIAKEIQNGKPVHQPIMIKPGKTKMIDESVPAAEATVCTMLFSCTVASRSRAGAPSKSQPPESRSKKSGQP